MDCCLFQRTRPGVFGHARLHSFLLLSFILLCRAELFRRLARGSQTHVGLAECLTAFGSDGVWGIPQEPIVDRQVLRDLQTIRLEGLGEGEGKVDRSIRGANLATCSWRSPVAN